MKLLLGTLAITGFVLGFYTATPVNAAQSPAIAAESAEAAACLPKGHACKKNFDCCNKGCWKGTCN